MKGVHTVIFLIKIFFFICVSYAVAAFDEMYINENAMLRSQVSDEAYYVKSHDLLK